MESRAKKIGVLYSGGLDSAALINQLLHHGYEVWPVYIACGLPWEKAEQYWSKKFLNAMRDEKLKPAIPVKLLLEGAYKKNWSQTGHTPSARSADEEVFLPARNLLLTTKALLALSSKDVWHLALATLRGNPFPDATPTYFKTLEHLLSESFWRPIKISLPFRTLTKKEVLQRNRRVPFHLTFSCINPKGWFHCGSCNKCAERQKAFKTASIADKTVYINQSKN